MKTVLTNLVSKVTSRKFLIAVVGIIVSACGAVTSTNTTVQLVLTIVGAVFGIVYMFVEGKCDWTSIATSVATIADAVDDLTSTSETEETEDTTDNTISVDSTNGTVTVGKTTVNVSDILSAVGSVFTTATTTETTTETATETTEGE